MCGSKCVGKHGLGRHENNALTRARTHGCLHAESSLNTKREREVAGATCYAIVKHLKVLILGVLAPLLEIFGGGGIGRVRHEDPEAVSLQAAHLARQRPEDLLAELCPALAACALCAACAARPSTLFGEKARRRGCVCAARRSGGGAARRPWDRRGVGRRNKGLARRLVRRLARHLGSGSSARGVREAAGGAVELEELLQAEQLQRGGCSDRRAQLSGREGEGARERRTRQKKKQGTVLANFINSSCLQLIYNFKMKNKN